ncbi:MAG: N-acetyl-gamma-glutamyl-phosphate reductase [Pirellulaceae bacterium]
MIRVGILGATGYTAVELIKILVRHPEVEIAALTSRQEGSPHVAAVHPQLAGRLDMRLEDLEPSQVAARCDCVFSCLPHGASATVVRQLLEAGKRVIDFSADYRLTNADVYAEWYGQKHADPEHLSQAVYGLPELFGDLIPAAQLIANPGCYPTSAILALTPFLKADLIDPSNIIVDSKSGVSGAGRTPKLMTHYPECNESVVAYNVGRHRHTPEIDQVLSTASQKNIQVVFTPHLIPMDRGILTSAYALPTRELKEELLLSTLRDFYAGKPFIRIVEHLPATKDVAGSNFCDITARLVRGHVIVFSCIDNLIKGASGAAVQNFNLMYGFPETASF